MAEYVKKVRIGTGAFEISPVLNDDFGLVLEALGKVAECMGVVEGDITKASESDLASAIGRLLTRGNWSFFWGELGPLMANHTQVKMDKMENPILLGSQYKELFDREGALHKEWIPFLAHALMHNVMSFLPSAASLKDLLAAVSKFQNPVG